MTPTKTLGREPTGAMIDAAEKAMFSTAIEVFHAMFDAGDDVEVENTVSDTLTHGTGYMLDGKHIPLTDFYAEDVVVEGMKSAWEWADSVLYYNDEWKVSLGNYSYEDSVRFIGAIQAEAISATEAKQAELINGLMAIVYGTGEFNAKQVQRIKELEDGLRRIDDSTGKDWVHKIIKQLLSGKGQAK